MFKVAPLGTSFMLTGILGFIISAYMIDNVTWAFAMCTIFAIVFIASIISMTYSNVDEKLK